MDQSDLPADVSVLVSSWRDGVFSYSAMGHGHEWKGHCVASLTSDGGSGVLAVVDGTSLVRRSPEGRWAEVASSEVKMQCCVVVDDVVYAGTEGAHLLRVNDRAGVERVRGFDMVGGRDTWFAGSAVVDGQVVGPPLSVRSLTGSSDGHVVLAGVHVGGIARSGDGGVSWHPTIDISWDVHEVLTHPNNPNLVIAACAVGLGVSVDGGVNWVLETPPSQEIYCSAVAFTGEELLVSVSENHFAAHGSVLRRAITSPGPLTPVGDGLPDRLNGIVDTDCIASKGSDVVVVDGGGDLYLSRDEGHSWTHVAEGIPSPSSALIA